MRDVTFAFAEIDGHAQQLPECPLNLRSSGSPYVSLQYAEPSHVHAVVGEAFAKMFEDGIGAADMGKDKIGKLHGAPSLIHPQPCRYDQSGWFEWRLVRHTKKPRNDSQLHLRLSCFFFWEVCLAETIRLA